MRLSCTSPTLLLHLAATALLGHYLLPWYQVLLALVVAPRLLGLLLGRWVLVGRSASDASNTPPLGRWSFHGNPFPEAGIALLPPYPTAPGEFLSGVQYYQSPTLGGLLVAPVHLFATPLIRVATTAHVVGPGSYLMPTLHDPKAGWQASVSMQPTHDPAVWRRSYPAEPQRTSYLWLHESVAPLEDWITFPPGAYGTAAALYAAAVALALIAWSRGTFVLVLLLEAAIKRGVYRLR